MPARSQAQRRLMAMAEHTPLYQLHGQARKMKKSMSHQQLHDFASTKEKGLPYHVKKRKKRTSR
ncbi:MAG: DUF3008 family protein [Patescibacteria group bacterium]|nr:DUF3008 family protein [Patescibacteria group bacterium]